MTSLFDSAVYAARREHEWAEIDIEYFMRDMAQSAEGTGTVTLSVHNRPSVRTRFWWMITWTGADGEQHTMEAESIYLCLWRAAVREKQLRENPKKEERP